MYNACSLAISGKEDMSHLLRALTSAELYLYSEFYASHPHFATLLASERSSALLETFFSHSISHEASDLLTGFFKNYADCVKHEALKNCQDRRWSPFICIMALSNVLGLPVFSFYPETCGRRYAINLSNAKIFPRDGTCQNIEPIRLLWSKAGGGKNDLNPSFKANHIVPLFLAEKGSLQQPVISTIVPKNEQCPKWKQPEKQAKISFPKKVSIKMPLESVNPRENETVEPNQLSSASNLQNLIANLTDIGSFYLNTASMTDMERYEKMLNVWKPDPKFAFPSRQIHGKSRKFVYSWLINYPWLAYSKLLDGTFCLPCVLFGRKTGQNASKLDKLMKSPLTDWSSASYRIKEHQNKSEIHKTALETMNRFKNVMESKEKSIDLIQNESLDKAVQQNRLKIASIAKCVLLFARQNIPLRGHRDDSQYYDTSDCGNFQALLDFRVESGDRILAEHFKTAPRNATFRSKTVQNELISCIAEDVNHQIIKEIKECGPYLILADEVTDCSNQQQMPLVIRYVDGNGDIQERFMKYITCDTGTTGDALKTKILNCITNDLNLDIMDCRGQCYDGAGNMAGKYSGVASRILEINDQALFTHCASHRLNLAVAASCKLQCIKNMMEFVRKIAHFFHTPKRQLLLEQMVKKHLKNYSHTKLINPCETRWILRIDALERFMDMYIPISEAMRTIRDNVDGNWDDCSADAFTYFFALQSFEFIMTLIIARMLLCYTRSATIQLQSSHLDFIEGLKQVDITMKTLRTVRDCIDAYHSSWFNDALKIAERMNASVVAPRSCKRQVYRANAPSNDVESYFKINIAIPFLDHLLQELSKRFSPQNRIAIKGISIVPGMLRAEYNNKSGQKRNWKETLESGMEDLNNGTYASSITDVSLSDVRKVGQPALTKKAPASKTNIEQKAVTIQRCDKLWKKNFETFCNQYANDLPDISFISHELDNWESAWIDVPDDQLPKNISDTLKMTNKISFPNIYACLKILAVLPVTSCTCERSASSVRLLKTYLRSRMTLERLNGLATTYTHRDKKVDIEKVIDNFARKNKRRLKLVNILDTDNNMETIDEAIVSEIY